MLYQTLIRYKVTNNGWNVNKQQDCSFLNYHKSIPTQRSYVSCDNTVNKSMIRAKANQRRGNTRADTQGASCMSGKRRSQHAQNASRSREHLSRKVKASKDATSVNGDRTKTQFTLACLLRPELGQGKRPPPTQNDMETYLCRPKSNNIHPW